MKIAMLLAPAIGWGLLPLSVSKVKNAGVLDQLVGTAIGSLLMTTILLVAVRPSFDAFSFAWGAVAGACWMIGQVGQYTGYKTIGVSATMPYSTGLQLIGVPLFGVLLFHEWATTRSKICGALGILALLLGVFLNSRNPGSGEQKIDKQARKVFLLLTVTALGYVACSLIPRGLHGDSIVIFEGESCGMLVMALVYTLVKKDLTAWTRKPAWLCTGGGAIYALASVAYVLDVQNAGVNTAFVLSQLAVVISTLSGFVFLHEKKTKAGYACTAAGLILIIGGAVLTTLF
jgi:glucose uptake protein